MQLNMKSTGGKILSFPLTRIIAGLLVCTLVVSVGQIMVGRLLGLTSIGKDINDLMTGIVAALLAIVTYTLLFRYYENRRITEFSGKGILKSLTVGIILGAVLQSLTILVIYLKGGYTIVSINPVIYVLPPLTMAFTSAVIEETLIRGIVFRIMEEKLGSYFALIISALLFGLLHLGNPNSSLTAAIGIAIQAGLLLAAAYIYTRNLWFPIAIHFAWNFTQSAIFGALVSGTSVSKTLITSEIKGAEWFTGGQFGPEGSVQATVFCLIATIVLMVLSHKEEKIIKPYWSKA